MAECEANTTRSYQCNEDAIAQGKTMKRWLTMGDKRVRATHKEVGGTFSCCENKLITLDGGPTTVGKDYICSESQLGSLAGAPKVIHGDFICKYNDC